MTRGTDKEAKLRVDILAVLKWVTKNEPEKLISFFEKKNWLPNYGMNYK